MLRRAFSTDNLLAVSPQPGKALIGTAAVGGEPFLVIKMAWRKNITSGCIMRRPCFCNLGTQQAISLCPVHTFWPAVRRRVGSGQPLFRKVNVGNFNRIMKAILTKMQIPEAARFSSHGFRLGTSQELKESGSPWEVVASAGMWNSPSFRGYVDMSKDVETSVARLLAVDMDSDSDCEPVRWVLVFSRIDRPMTGRPDRFPLGMGALSGGSGGFSYAGKTSAEVLSAT